MATDYALFSENVLISMLQNYEKELFMLAHTEPEPGKEDEHRINIAFAHRNVLELAAALKIKAESQNICNETAFSTTSGTINQADKKFEKEDNKTVPYNSVATHELPPEETSDQVTSNEAHLESKQSHIDPAPIDTYTNPLNQNSNSDLAKTQEACNPVVTEQPPPNYLAATAVSETAPTTVNCTFNGEQRTTQFSEQNTLGMNSYLTTPQVITTSQTYQPQSTVVTTQPTPMHYTSDPIYRADFQIASSQHQAMEAIPPSHIKCFYLFSFYWPCCPSSGSCNFCLNCYICIGKFYKPTLIKDRFQLLSPLACQW